MNLELGGAASVAGEGRRGATQDDAEVLVEVREKPGGW